MSDTENLNEAADSGLRLTACSPSLLTPETAPRDGTMIIAHMGWPWMVPASWNAETNVWQVAIWNASQLDETSEDMETWWESDTDADKSLKGWLPWPQIPEND